MNTPLRKRNVVMRLPLSVTLASGAPPFMWLRKALNGLREASLEWMVFFESLMEPLGLKADRAIRHLALLRRRSGHLQNRGAVGEAETKDPSSLTSSFVKGREVLAMIIMNFRTTSHTEVMFNVQNLYCLKYPGDKHIGRFLATPSHPQNDLRFKPCPVLIPILLHHTIPLPFCSRRLIEQS